MAKYQVRNHINGDVIDEFDELDVALATAGEFVINDKKEGIYEPEFYEVYDAEKEEVIEVTE